MTMKQIDTVETGRRIHQLCMEKGLRPVDIQEQLCLCSVQSVYKWFSEKSTSLPTLDNCVLLAALLDCRIDDLLVVKECVEEHEEQQAL